MTPNKSQELDLSDLGLDFNVSDEETAQKYMEFLQSKLETVNAENDEMLKAEVARRDAMIDSLPRAQRRAFLKDSAKFSDRIKRQTNLHSK